MTKRTPDMVQVHLLTPYPAALLNRDDAGFAKRVPFGGVWRTRISSQCLKKHWRDADVVKDLGPEADRSRLIYERRIIDPLMSNEVLHASREEAQRIAQYLLDLTLARSEKGEKKSREKRATDATAPAEVQPEQVIVLTHAEVQFLVNLGEWLLGWLGNRNEDVTEEQLNTAFLEYLEQNGILDNSGIKRISVAELQNKKKRTTFLRDVREKYMSKLPASVDTAMFGRMITSDLFARVDAAVSVAHSFTTHKEQKDIDYFTAVDTLKGDEDDAGAALINETELTSGVFYTYAVIDMNQLRDNLIGHPEEMVERLGRNLVKAMSTVSPGAKKGSTAPFSRAEFVLLERGGEQPRTLANAFLEPVRANGASVMVESARKLLEHRRKLEEMYGDDDGQSQLATIHELNPDGLSPVPLRKALDTIFAG